MAELVLRFMEEDGGSRALAETKAYAADAYKDHVLRMVEARREANRARVEFDVRARPPPSPSSLTACVDCVCVCFINQTATRHGPCGTAAHPCSTPSSPSPGVRGSERACGTAGHGTGGSACIIGWERLSVDVHPMACAVQALKAKLELVRTYEATRRCVCAARSFADAFLADTAAD